MSQEKIMEDDTEFVVTTEEVITVVRQYETIVHAPDSETAADLFFGGHAHERKLLREISRTKNEPFVLNVDIREPEAKRS